MVSIDLERPWEPDPDSVRMMRHIDGMKPSMRALVREYGYIVIRELLAEADNPYDPCDLAEILRTWRERRQEDWLATDWVTSRSAKGIADALAKRMALKDEEAEIWLDSEHR